MKADDKGESDERSPEASTNQDTETGQLTMSLLPPQRKGWGRGRQTTPTTLGRDPEVTPRFTAFIS